MTFNSDPFADERLQPSDTGRVHHRRETGEHAIEHEDVERDDLRRIGPASRDALGVCRTAVYERCARRRDVGAPRPEDGEPARSGAETSAHLPLAPGLSPETTHVVGRFHDLALARGSGP